MSKQIFTPLIEHHYQINLSSDHWLIVIVYDLTEPVAKKFVQKKYPNEVVNLIQTISHF
jgi:hypothetical protein